MYLRVYSRARWLFFLLSSIQRRDEDWPLLAFLSSSITSTDKNWSQTKKKKKGHVSALPASVAGSSYLSSSKVKNKDRWTTNGIDRTVSVAQTERVSSRKAWSWIERDGHFPCPAHGTGLWQTFKPQLSVQLHAQATLTTHEERRRLHENFFAPDVNNRRSPSPKTKPCEKLKKSFLSSLCLWPQSFFSFVFLFFLSRFTVALSNSKQIWPHARKNGKSPDVQKIALVPPLAQVGFTDLLLSATCGLVRRASQHTFQRKGPLRIT